MKELAQVLLNAASDYALLLDAEGTVLGANDIMAKRLGLAVDQLVGERIFDFFPYEHAMRRQDILEEVVRSGKPRHFHESSLKGGFMETRVHPVLDAEGRVLTVAVFSRDITETIRAEEERIRLATAIEQSADGFLILDGEFRIQYVNQAFELMTGFTQSEARGLDWSHLYQGQVQTAQVSDIKQTLLEGEVWTGRTRNTRRDGTVFQSEKTVSPIRARGGSVLGYVSVWRDVTQLDVLEQQFRRAQKMEAIGTLAGGIAHDFNNILGPIILHSELALSSLTKDAPYRGSFEEILKASNRARDLVDQILNLSRSREQDEPIPFGLTSIVKECLKLLRPSLPATINIDLKEEQDRDMVLADPTQVHQVIMNLCTNAAHAMEGKWGLLSLTVRNRRLDPDEMRSLHGAGPGEYVELVVADTGCGIRPELMDRIFDPFYTTKKEGVGTGLGLTVVQSIVSRLRGVLTVRSEPDKGAAFHVLLPASIIGPAQNGSSPDRMREAQEGRGRIMLVDDEMVMLTGNRTVLEKLGYEVLCCSDSRQALDTFKREPDHFDLVLTDVTMPGMTGVDLATELLAIRPDLPVVLTSGYTELVSPEKSRVLGIRAFLKKPYHVEELAETVGRIMLSQESDNSTSNSDGNE